MLSSGEKTSIFGKFPIKIEKLKCPVKWKVISWPKISKVSYLPTSRYLTRHIYVFKKNGPLAPLVVVFENFQYDCWIPSGQFTLITSFLSKLLFMQKNSMLDFSFPAPLVITEYQRQWWVTENITKKFLRKFWPDPI